MGIRNKLKHISEHCSKNTKYEGMKNFYEKNGYFVADIWLKRSVQTFEDHIEQEAIYQTRQI